MGHSPLGRVHMKRRATAGSKIAKARRKAKKRCTAPLVGPRPPSEAALREQLDESRRELKEALEHQAATSEVLDLISQTPTNVQPVFDEIRPHDIEAEEGKVLAVVYHQENCSRCARKLAEQESV
jgi:hypothetical protein